MGRKTGIALFAAAVAVTILGCGDDKKVTPPPTFNEQAWQWPASPYHGYGNQIATIKGKVDNPTDSLRVVAMLGQTPATSPTAPAADGTFSLSVTLNHGTNQIQVSFSDAEQHQGSALATVVFPFLDFESPKFQKASNVFGQPGMTSAASGTTASTLSAPIGSPAIMGDLLLVPDSSNNRVVGYPRASTQSPPEATFVLGQTDLTSSATGGGPTATRLPRGLLVTEGKLFVVSFSNRRIQIYDPFPTQLGQALTRVVGQTDQILSQYSCNDTIMDGPSGVSVVGNKMVVADSNHVRVLVYNSIPTTEGVAASFVLGQPSFTSCDIDFNLTAATTRFPTNVWTDGTRLLVADRDNGRVLLWNTFPTATGTPADVIIGQANSTTSNLSLVTDRDLKSPSYIASNGNQIFVTDTLQNRVLVWNGFPTQDHQPADMVLGQNSFTAGAANDDNQDGTPDGTPSDRTFSKPNGLLLTDTQLYVTDTNNNRVLVFNGK